MSEAMNAQARSVNGLVRPRVCSLVRRCEWVVKLLDAV